MEEIFSGQRRFPRGYLLLVPAVAFLVMIGSATYKRTDVPRPGDRVPEISAPLLVGSGDFALSDLRGTPVVVNFWASWCAPCEDEAPLLARASEAYAGKVAFLGVDIRDARSDAEAFVAEHDLDYPHVRDEGMAVYARYGLTGQPETFFIDAEGILVEHVPGPLDEERLFELLDVLVSRSA